MKRNFWWHVNGLLWSFSLWIAACFNAMAQQSPGKADPQPYSLLLTTKLHSTSHSPYSGTYWNHHPNMEISLLARYKQLGAFITRNVDFVDVHSAINFTTVGVFKSFQVGKSLKLTPYLGYFLRQSCSFVDDGSDMWACVVIGYKVNRWFSVENTALVGNLIKHHENVALANRLNVTIAIANFKLDAYTWYAHSFNGAPHFVSSSLAVTSPDWVITRTISAKMQVAMLQYVSDEKPDGAFHRGGLISLVVPIKLVNNH